MQIPIGKGATPFCPDRETLKLRLQADIRVYMDAVAELQQNVESDRLHQQADRARLAYEVSRKKLYEHTAAHGCD